MNCLDPGHDLSPDHPRRLARATSSSLSIGKLTCLTTKRAGVFATLAQLENGVKVITIPDIRWLRRDIKSVALLPQVLGKQQAAKPARSKLGRSMATVMSPRAAPAMPGS